MVVRGRLWRVSDPRLSPEVREGLVRELMAARREIGQLLGGRWKGDPARAAEARARVDAAKRALGERGPVWSDDPGSSPGQAPSPDLNRRMVAGTPYAAWWAELQGRERATGGAGGEGTTESDVGGS